ncbi:Asp/Glu racemase [Roseomonas alkaliterrae]|uniref:Asp/Glu/hydantoin racemase n=1 Tax=Neoroseomonas alkaliterrae TaxID=1452450 RepID=A0A840Y331_9PROT|nr:aspartate/glutamate racemase family protein [Neoroseomonas alkaliterrae]MBB5690401.1 Asp/Glu/hydantoin racemase [Neoroseomonas alkaliterrae]MBR0675215.1 Asp/Glu racemase [Neoroseomonas alkaliterrae]
MAERILLINPNSSRSCTEGIAAAVAPYAAPGLPRLDVVRIEDGPPAIVTWRDWFGIAEPLCRMVEREPADAYILACVSDPGLEAVRTVTDRPVFGPLRCAVAAAMMRGERFGIIAFTDKSKPRQRRALQSMGVEERLAGIVPLNLDMEVLTDPAAPRPRIAAAAKELAGMGAESIILGCAGMAGHRAFAEDSCGLPVIEPCQAAVVQAILAVVAARGERMRAAAE